MRYKTVTASFSSWMGLLYSLIACGCQNGDKRQKKQVFFSSGLKDCTGLFSNNKRKSALQAKPKWIWIDLQFAFPVQLQGWKCTSQSLKKMYLETASPFLYYLVMDLMLQTLESMVFSELPLAWESAGKQLVTLHG